MQVIILLLYADIVIVRLHPSIAATARGCRPPATIVVYNVVYNAHTILKYYKIKNMQSRSDRRQDAVVQGGCCDIMACKNEI